VFLKTKIIEKICKSQYNIKKITKPILKKPKKTKKNQKSLKTKIMKILLK
jgi:hypothetical protein